MMYLQTLRDIGVTFGSLTLHLRDYRITGGVLLREQGTSEGSGAVAAVYPKGTRITLKGKLSPPEGNFAQAGAALDAALRSGLPRTFQIGSLVCEDMRLIGYTLSAEETAADVTLVFYTQVPLDTGGSV